MKLLRGNAYEVTDWYGMVSFTATYVGVAQRGHSLCTKLYLMERLPADRGSRSCYKYAGCELRADVRQDGEVVPYLFATHYGNTVAQLQAAAGHTSGPWVLL